MSERVCVVAGAGAWPFYLATGAWVGQENRRFGDATRLGFYSGRQVQGLAPRIREVVASVPLDGRGRGHPRAERRSHGAARGRGSGRGAARRGDGAAGLGRPALAARRPRRRRRSNPSPTTADTAWTMFQRFVDLDRLRTATSTADLGSG